MDRRHLYGCIVIYMFLICAGNTARGPPECIPGLPCAGDHEHCQYNECICDVGYIRDSGENICENEGDHEHCQSKKCICDVGYIPDSWENICENEDIDECSPSPCQNGGSCTDGTNSYTCNCVAGYTGTACDTAIDECSPSPCQNGGSCTDGTSSYTCNCVAGYTGTSCDTDIDECSPSPCQNGGSCTDGTNSFTCNCVAGYTGTACDTDIDECSPSPCQNGGSCTDGINSYTCNCVAGYTGTACDTVESPTTEVTRSETTGERKSTEQEHKGNTGANTAAAVLIPVVIFALVLVAVGVIYIRRKRRRDKKNNKRISTVSVTDNARKRTTVSVSNRAYTDRLDDEIIGSKPQQSGSRDSEYAEITDVDQNNSEYHAISFKPEEFTVGAGYGHLPKQKHNTDNAYAHITGNHSAGHSDTTYSHIRDTGEIKKGTDNTVTSDNSDQAYNTLQPIDRRGVQHNAVEDNDEYNHTHFPMSTTTTEVADKSLSEGYMSLGTRTATPYEVVEKQGVTNVRVKNSTNSALSEENGISNHEGNATHDSRVQSADDSGHNYFVLQKNDPNIDKHTDTGQNNYFVLEKSN